MTDRKMMLSHGDTDITAIFARLVDDVFGGEVTILPNVDVLNAARRQARRGPVELSVVADRGYDADGSERLYTVYRVGRATLLIDAHDNATTDLDDVVMDEDARDEFVADHPNLATLMSEMISAWENS